MLVTLLIALALVFFVMRPLLKRVLTPEQQPLALPVERRDRPAHWPAMRRRQRQQCSPQMVEELERRSPKAARPGLDEQRQVAGRGAGRRRSRPSASWSTKTPSRPR